jgi:hypothetical protein
LPRSLWYREDFMADRARNADGLGRALAFMITPMDRPGAFVAGVVLWIDRWKSTENTTRPSPASGRVQTS